MPSCLTTISTYHLNNWVYGIHSFPGQTLLIVACTDLLLNVVLTWGIPVSTLSCVFWLIPQYFRYTYVRRIKYVASYFNGTVSTCHCIVCWIRAIGIAKASLWPVYSLKVMIQCRAIQNRTTGQLDYEHKEFYNSCSE